MTTRILSNFLRYSSTSSHYNYRSHYDKRMLLNSLITHFNKPIDSKQLSRHYSSKAMRFIRFQSASDAEIRLGSLSEDGKQFTVFDESLPNDIIELIKLNKSPSDFDKLLKSSKWQSLTDDTKLLAPIPNPEKIICIGLNYLGHCKEQNKDAPKEPMFFSKFASAITSPNGDVILHEITNVCIKSKRDFYSTEI